MKMFIIIIIRAGSDLKPCVQMGLFVDMMNPEDMMMGVGENDPNLEAELAAITGSKPATGRGKQAGRSEFHVSTSGNMEAQNPSQQIII